MPTIGSKITCNGTFSSKNSCSRPFIFTKWPPSAIWDAPKITFDRISRHFRLISNFYVWFFSQNGRHFGCPENHFRLHFSPFQINTHSVFLQNGRYRPCWMLENHFWSHFSQFQINMQLFCIYVFRNDRWWQFLHPDSHLNW